MAESGKCAGLEPSLFSFQKREKSTVYPKRENRDFDCLEDSQCAQARMGSNPILRAVVTTHYFISGGYNVITTFFNCFGGYN